MINVSIPSNFFHWVRQESRRRGCWRAGGIAGFGPCPEFERPAASSEVVPAAMAEVIACDAGVAWSIE